MTGETLDQNFQKQCCLNVQRGFQKVLFLVACYFLITDRKSSMGVAGMLIIWTVPRDPSSIETRVMASLFGASTMFTKSYFPNTEYCCRTLAPKTSISLLTSLILSGLPLMVFLPSEVRVDKRM